MAITEVWLIRRPGVSVELSHTARPAGGRRVPRHLERAVVLLAVGRRREPERPFVGEPPHGLDGAVDERQPLAVALQHPHDDKAVELLRLLAKVELLVHVPGPLGRAHAHHVRLRPVVPPTAPLARQRLPHFVPHLLGVEQETVEVKDDGVDHAAK